MLLHGALLDSRTQARLPYSLFLSAPAQRAELCGETGREDSGYINAWVLGRGRVAGRVHQAQLDAGKASSAEALHLDSGPEGEVLEGRDSALHA